MANSSVKYLRFLVNHSRVIEVEKTAKIQTHTQGLTKIKKIMGGTRCFAISIL